jgi:hypothetical protein
LVTTELAEEVRSTSTTHQERARQAYEGPPTAIETPPKASWREPAGRKDRET